MGDDLSDDVTIRLGESEVSVNNLIALWIDTNTPESFKNLIELKSAIEQAGYESPAKLIDYLQQEPPKRGRGKNNQERLNVDQAEKYLTSKRLSSASPDKTKTQIYEEMSYHEKNTANDITRLQEAIKKGKSLFYERPDDKELFGHFVIELAEIDAANKSETNLTRRLNAKQRRRKALANTADKYHTTSKEVAQIIQNYEKSLK